MESGPPDTRCSFGTYFHGGTLNPKPDPLGINYPEQQAAPQVHAGRSDGPGDLVPLPSLGVSAGFSSLPLGSKDSYFQAFGPKNHTIQGFWAILSLGVSRALQVFQGFLRVSIGVYSAGVPGST